jgi:hypothetical protein
LVLLLPTLLSRCLYEFSIVAYDASAGPQLAALIAWKLDLSVSSGYKSRRLERTNSWFFIITTHYCTYAAITDTAIHPQCPLSPSTISRLTVRHSRTPSSTIITFNTKHYGRTKQIFVRWCAACCFQESETSQETPGGISRNAHRRRYSAK